MRKLLVGCFVVATACVAGLQFPEVRENGFERIEYSTSPGGFGYCVNVGEPTHVLIEQTDDGYEASGTLVVARGDVDEFGECIEPQDTGACWEAMTFGPVMLEADELDELRDLLANMPAKSCKEDTNLACDYCMVSSLEVDGESVSRDCCGDLNEDFAQDYDEVLDLFGRIASR